MQAFQSASDLIRAEELKGPADLYAAFLTVKNGFGNGLTKLGCYRFTKAEIKRAGISWDFVVQSCELLGLRLENKNGRHGHMVSK
jgi:hypothetical protein